MPQYELVESEYLTVLEDVIVDVHLRRRGIVIHRKRTVSVPDPAFYKIETHGKTLIVAHPATMQKLRNSIALEFQEQVEELARRALYGT